MGGKKSKLSKKKIEDLSIKTKFTAAEIKSWYSGFLKDCPSGQLSKDRVNPIYRQFFPSGDSGTFSNLVFNLFDANGDGTIEFEEFLTALSVTSRGNPEDKLEWAFKLYDLDGDGTISKPEMLKIVKAISTMTGQSDDQFKPAERVEKIFATMDEDGNGELTKAEFLEGARRDRSIMQGVHF
ncbi:unnamed protein product [Oikopleura dioica]|uniref:EF-hand domain-containing protein n=1 Tax=Oikopleura dioica TaxID=34765 RepID=E4XD60_OIKDI|nr:unnamed protein product [Oikopleura dioica]